MKTFKIVFSLLLIYFFTSAVLRAEDVPITSIFNEHSDSIVLIGALDRKQGHLGSGFIVRQDGLIVTNYHLVKQAKKIIIKLKNNQGYKRVRVVGVDANKDIALLKIDAQGLKPVSLGNSSKIVTGERVVSIGNPLGLESTISDGLISSIRKTNAGFKIFQTSVPLSNGSSGGPIFNLQGEVIGIATASNQKGQNLNFAVPINEVKPLIRRYDTGGGQKKRKPRRTVAASLSQGAPGVTYYTVQRRDTLFSLAKRFSTTVERIQAFNRLKDAHIKTGQRLKIPQ